MKNLILCLLAFTSSISFTYAQWQQTNGPHGNPITCIAARGTNIFAGTTGGGVFSSPDSGTTWTAVNNGLSDSNITSLAISGTNIFAGTANSGVFLSSNNGGSWSAVNNGLTIVNITSLATSGTNIFAGTSGGGIFLSSNNGGSWIAVNNGLTDQTIFSLAISGTNVFAGSEYLQIFLSTDSGASWNRVYFGFSSTQVSSLVVNGGNVLAGTNAGGVFLSSDTGSTWTMVNNGLTALDITSLAASGTNIFAGSYSGGVFLSTDIGSNWTAVNNGLTVLDIASLAISGTNVFAGIDTAGVWKSRLSDIVACAPVIHASSGTSFFCGGSVTLSNSVGNSFLWSDGETSQNIVVTTAGDYSCYVTTSCGTITTNIIPVAIVDSISAGGATTFCQRGSVTLTANNASDYLWSDGETTQSIVAITSSDYSCNVTTSCGIITTNTITVTVNSLPVATITPAGASIAICQGGMLSADGGSFYLWSDGETTQSITVSSPESYSVTVTDDNGCSATSSATVTTIYPNPQPVISPLGTIKVCEGDSVTLTSNLLSGNYWTTRDSTQSITVKSTGTYAVTVTSPHGCSASSSNDTVIVYSIPPDPTIDQFNDSLKSSYATGNQWYLNGTIISGGTGQFYVPTQSGIYTVEFRNGNGCSSTSAPFSFTTIGVGITELLSDYSFSIYPNPAGDQLMIGGLRLTKETSIDIYNVLGQIVQEERVSHSNTAVINVKKLAAGVYFVRVPMGDERGTLIGRFVKE